MFHFTCRETHKKQGNQIQGLNIIKTKLKRKPK